MSLPGITDAGTSDWVLKKDFEYFGFRSGNGMFRRGTPVGFPQGIRWKTRMQGRGYVAIKADGFDPEYKQDLSNYIKPEIRRRFIGHPCLFTGTTTQVEIDHRAGDKTHPAHISASQPASQVADDFMPLARGINHIKREACKKCVATGIRPELPPLFAHKQQHEGEGCFGCFWFEPELYV